MVFSNDQFSKKLYNELKTGDTNLIVSPFSVSAVMAMLSAGARGKTLKLIRKCFFYPSQNDLQLGYQNTLPALSSTEDYTLEVANTIFLKKDRSVLPDFQAVLRRSFLSSFQSVDFSNSHAAAGVINTWVGKKTREKIQDLINPKMISSNTFMVLVNAIYFKGDWAGKLTEDDTFLSILPAQLTFR